MKYDKKFKLKLIKYFKAGNSSIGKIAQREQIPRQTLARWIKLHRKFGERGLENRKSGAKGIPINLEAETKILQLWKEGKRSRYSMRKNLKIKGINVSEWSINKIYKKYKLIY